MGTKIGLILLSLAVGAAAAEEGLVAHYMFDEGAGSVAGDASGHGLQGAIHGAEYVELDQGYALRFDGVDDYVEIPDSEMLRLSDAVTVTCWVNTSVRSGQTVLSKNGCSTLRQNYRLSLGQNAVRFSLVECPEHGKSAAGGGVRQDSWFHLAGRYDGDGIRVYVNGGLRGRYGEPFATGTLEAPMYIGASFYGSGLGGHFTGQIDDVRVYNRALSDREIVTQYEAEKDLRISMRDRLMAQTTPVVERDTRPPVLVLPSPAPDTRVDGSPVISAVFDDEGSGIDVASVRVLLDGEDVTAGAAVAEGGFTFSETGALEDGIHQVEVVVNDRAGNAGNRLRWRFGVNEPVSLESRFDGDVFRVNGEPFFPVGIYSSNVSPTSRVPYIAQAAEAGINYKLIGEGAGEMLDDLLDLGMKGLVHVYYASLALGRGEPGQLTEVVQQAKDHPAMLGWWNEYASDNQSPLATETYELIRQHDTDHPVIFMLTWGGRLSDAYFVYGYPILNPLLPDDSITSIYELVLDDAFEAARVEGKGKHVWFISQAFDYRLDSKRGEVVTLEGGFRPSREEIRSMNYLALTRGVKGLLFYAPGGEIPGTEYTDDVAIYPRQWTEVLKVASEVRHLAPILAAGTQVQGVRLEQEGDAIHFIERLHDGVHTLIAVNVEPALVLGTWRFDGPVQPRVLFEDRMAQSESREFIDLFLPLEVHVYQWADAGD
ncbi:MAG: Ig-like domain-containing protein [Gemmatimonadota bacterium]|nr:Ig-like domain-containing protein [Gemmatimonadota bacterium]